jgi:hypothetical protein
MLHVRSAETASDVHGQKSWQIYFSITCQCSKERGRDHRIPMSSAKNLPHCGKSILQTPETTKPLHFCKGFVLYGAAPGVELKLNLL